MSGVLVIVFARTVVFNLTCATGCERRYGHHVVPAIGQKLREGHTVGSGEFDSDENSPPCDVPECRPKVRIGRLEPGSTDRNPMRPQSRMSGPARDKFVKRLSGIDADVHCKCGRLRCFRVA